MTNEENTTVEKRARRVAWVGCHRVAYSQTCALRFPDGLSSAPNINSQTVERLEITVEYVGSAQADSTNCIKGSAVQQ